MGGGLRHLHHQRKEVQVHRDAGICGIRQHRMGIHVVVAASHGHGAAAGVDLSRVVLPGRVHLQRCAAAWPPAGHNARDPEILCADLRCGGGVLGGGRALLRTGRLRHQHRCQFGLHRADGHFDSLRDLVAAPDQPGRVVVGGRLAEDDRHRHEHRVHVHSSGIRRKSFPALSRSDGDHDRLRLHRDLLADAAPSRRQRNAARRLVPPR